MTTQKKLFIVEILLLMVFMVFQANSQIPILPTKLKVTILNELGNPIESATVTIYKKKADYLNSENPVATGKTNKKGSIIFKKLNPIIYYIDARFKDKNNDGMGTQTDTLQEGRINLVNVVIE